MLLYADTPARRTLQLAADLFFVLWLVLWVWVGLAVHDGTMALASPGRQTDESASAMAGLWVTSRGRKISDGTRSTMGLASMTSCVTAHR